MSRGEVSEQEMEVMRRIRRREIYHDRWTDESTIPAEILESLRGRGFLVHGVDRGPSRARPVISAVCLTDEAVRLVENTTPSVEEGRDG